MKILINSTNLIYALHRDNFQSSRLNANIRDGIKFEIHPFPFKNALLLIYRYLEGGDMDYEIVKVDERGVGCYGTQTTYSAGFYTPETLCKRAQEDFNLIEGDEVDAEFEHLILNWQGLQR
ncbi:MULTISPECIES: hypothetical protein [Cyanophyceae]|uniref:hypothetical protein n=1 Tax=Cyanophyceae TaxID=3028117 RepID=UPI001687228E|nr:hypothetical protein [Trichocoleus sp. FACHB-40]MBD2001899.1 hypothetical protein [Trichocoleus sp. FACHB-40]